MAVLMFGLALAHSGHYLPASGPGAVEFHPPKPLPVIELLGQDARPTRFPQSGSVWAVYFGYTGCPDACPLTLNHLSALVEKGHYPGLRLAFISVDERDTPAMVARYVEGFKPVVGFSGKPQQLRILADAVGLEYNPAPGGRLIFHTDALAFLSAESKVLRVLYGVSKLSQNELGKELKRLL
jgi:protein SCO1/2